MTDSGYFIFWSKAALLVYEDEQRSPLGWKAYDDRETWAVVVGRFKNFYRNPVTWKLQAWDPATSAKPEGLYELTLMLLEKHGHELYHRVGMEREIDERKAAGWDWKYRRFQVGGPGRGERKRFGVSPPSPVYLTCAEEEEDIKAICVD
ncbi:uncharacterized protein PHACADRAFT_33710 [Phanerochaete carnosa HHB-10118-sp]|uniref:Uncharacterized protein n=1 Tax=Phanerochaete carnosa (strain HHB-10118-sp) TaxID=650164 RepID=K5VCT3_PHACS|nr:uncharacterized protein PHACADRAFT_33710 [Phanerochaete carnosa HHB-10118-sp]EKM48893.1 hypothetical protein PHACADRAFT_33710 [Phanerochaete carnosa HHB-10118-sp]